MAIKRRRRYTFTSTNDLTGCIGCFLVLLVSAMLATGFVAMVILVIRAGGNIADSMYGWLFGS